MPAIIDTLVSVVVILVFFLIIYTNWRQQKMKDTILELKYAIEELKGGSEEEEEYGRGYI